MSEFKSRSRSKGINLKFKKMSKGINPSIEEIISFIETGKDKIHKMVNIMTEMYKKIPD